MKTQNGYSVTENLSLLFQGKDTQILIQELLPNRMQVQEQVTPKSGNRKFFCSFTFWGHLTQAYNTEHEI